MRRVSMVMRDELLAAVAARYCAGARAEKIRILDEFAAVTGYHRKHAMRPLSRRVDPHGATAPQGLALRNRIRARVWRLATTSVGNHDLGNISVRQKAICSGAFLNEAIRILILIVAAQYAIGGAGQGCADDRMLR